MFRRECPWRKLRGARSEEHEAEAVKPLFLRVADVGVQPPTAVVPADTEQVEAASHVSDGLVHDDEGVGSHLLDLLVGDRFAEQGRDLDGRGQVAAALCLGTDIFVRPISVGRELLALDDDEIVDRASRGGERRVTQELLRVVAHTEALAIEAGDPLFASLADRREGLPECLGHFDDHPSAVLHELRDLAAVAIDDGLRFVGVELAPVDVRYESRAERYCLFTTDLAHETSPYCGASVPDAKCAGG